MLIFNCNFFSKLSNCQYNYAEISVLNVKWDANWTIFKALSGQCPDNWTTQISELSGQFVRTIVRTESLIVNINYNSKFEKAKSCAEIWSQRNLTLLGKVLIIKLLILSQFTYLVLPLPRPNYHNNNRKNIISKIPDFNLLKLIRGT